MTDRQRIAVVGGGISGLATAWLLSRRHEVHLFEANDYVGGHTNTELIESGGLSWPVNTGFIVYNDWTYPNFIRLMNELGIDSEASSMSFSVQSPANGLEYSGTSLNTLFAQRRNIVNPRFLNMIRQIVRFNRLANATLCDGALRDDLTLGEWLDSCGFSDYFRRHYVIPMGAAIWSSAESDIQCFPARFFLQFFSNHGMLAVHDRPTWRVIKGGSARYVRPMLAPLEGRVYTGIPVTAIRREPDSVSIHSTRGEENFDQVVIAAHADQALAMLSDPSDDERRILGDLPYTENEVVLHTDTRLLPRNRRAWAAWNYHLPGDSQQAVSVTYNMNILQNFNNAPDTFCVTLNRSDAIRPDAILRRYRYAHPCFTAAGVRAQSCYERIGAHNRTHYCGAYWFNGFHEDGVRSAMRVAKSLGVDWR